MRIGVNLLNLSQDKFGGVQQYLQHLLAYLADGREPVELYLFLDAPHKDVFPEDQPKIMKVILKNGLAEPSDVFKAINRYQVDLWFCPLHRSYLPHIPVPTVVTIHDVLHTSFPEFVPGGLHSNNQYYKKYAPSFNAVITVSRFSKKGIADHLPIPARNIHTIYPDAPKIFRDLPNEELKAKIKGKYRLPDDYAFYPASYNPHKNHLNLLKALLLVRDKHHIRIPLVLTGYFHRNNKCYRRVDLFLKDHDLLNQVKILGYIPPEHMPYLYYHSRFLVFPSLYEGFGFPLVEAMHTQTPIVCSEGGSIPEITGGAALLFNPREPEDIASKMLQVLNPQTRKMLIQKGKERAKVFSWEKNAHETLKVFRRVVEAE